MEIMRNVFFDVTGWCRKYPYIAFLIFVGIILFLRYPKYGRSDSSKIEKAQDYVQSTVSKDFENDNIKAGGTCDMDEYHSSNRRICDIVMHYVNQGSRVPSTISDQLSHNTDCRIEKVEKSCLDIRNAFIYRKSTSEFENSDFPLAYGIKIHTNANQAFRLLRYIYTPKDVFCIHVDGKAPPKIFHSFKRIQKCFNNIVVINEPVTVIYSSIRQVEAEMKCLKAVRTSHVKWKYYINLTGQEFMLKTRSEIVQFLKILNGSNDIESYQIPAGELHRLGQVHTIGNNKIYRTKQQKIPFHIDIKMQKGSAYGMFSRDFVDFVLDHVFVKVFMKWLEDTYAPEEIIWATLNALPSTPGGDIEQRRYSNGKYHSRAVIWRSDKSKSCSGKYVHNVCVYGVGDLPWLLDNKYMVANKFYEDYEPAALTCLESAMYDKLSTGA
ncbi:N-acetyllactosaminide beta-1,6-N-acetylglucosaminyl-transferase-like [Mya arenaria]|uniref:N-acetyllactosaminide beta-1,6-N-acetylglucosaminyl-transferase-like n=1 Tax=Mya arenaria TaxID=6604 RepID=UPI0022E8BAF9|nr:N-acetyllactosaminide beta-1,6-N-acetylglucosaminyl-transferase-like [Mya arenaria]